MRKYITMVFYLLLAVAFQFNYLIAQPPTLSAVNTTPPASPGQVEFTIDDLPTNLTSNRRKFNYDPYHQAFIIYGDGNFERRGDLRNPIVSPTIFPYQYRDMQYLYPVALRLIERKNDDDPPDEDEMVVPGDPPPVVEGDFVDVNGGGTFNPVVLNTISTSEPTSPMIDDSDNAKIAIGLSHYGGNRYYLKDNAILAFPIAFKPETKAILLFFYNNGAGDEFRYYDNSGDELLLKDPSFSSISQVGTILPNYFDPTVTGATDPSMLLSRMSELFEDLASNMTLGSTLDPKNFRKGIRYDVPEEESELLPSGALLSAGATPGELRLFHFLKSADLAEGVSYPFVAILYDLTDLSTDDTTRYGGDTTNLGSIINFPQTFIEGNDTYNFVDAVKLVVEHGEPDDPNGLTIEKICKCCDEYIVDFKLTFHNREDAGGAASGANILLDNIDGLLGASGAPIFSDFKLQGCFREGAGNNCTPQTPPPPTTSDCPYERPPYVSDPLDATYCFHFSPELAPGRDGYILFSAKIQAADIDLLTQDSVLRYCVDFHGGFDVGSVCGHNKTLQKEICEVLDPLTKETVIITPADAICLKESQLEGRVPKCKRNPIWVDKDINCSSSDCNCNTCFFCCTWYCWIGLLIALGLLSFFINRFRKNRPIPNVRKE